jgi:hypothetical protein
MKKMLLIFTLVIILTMVMGTMAFASENENSISGAVGEIQDAEGVLQGDAKNKVLGISKDIMDIVVVIVTAIVVISGLITGVQFAGAGDNPQKKASLKSKLIYHILGLVFLANYFGLFNFLFKNAQIFTD